MSEAEVMEEDLSLEGKPTHDLLSFLDEGNLAKRLKELKNADGSVTAEGVYAESQRLLQEAEDSMGPWLKKYKQALFLAKQQPNIGGTPIDSKDDPFKGASLAMLPYVMEAMLDFNSRAAPELVWPSELVKIQMYGAETEQKAARAERVSKYMNKQLLDEMEDWQDEQDKLLLVLPCVGTAFKETYYESDSGEMCSDLFMADEVIFDHNYKSFKKAPDKFKYCKYSRNEVIQYIRGDEQWDIDEDDLEDKKNTFEFVKAYTWVDLDQDGIAEPYLLVLWPEKNQIVSVLPQFDEDTITLNSDDELIRIEAVERFTQYRFIPDPEGGPMGMGWGILLGPLFSSINTTLRQMLDAGMTGQRL